MGGEKLNPDTFIFRAVLLALSFTLIILPVYAQNEQENLSGPLTGETRSSPEETMVLGEAPAQETVGGGPSVWIVIQMVLVLALAALAIYGVVFLIKRLARTPQSRDPHLKVLASVPLAGDSFAAVVSVGSKAWLVGGGSGGGISLISEIEDQEALESMLLDEAQKTAEAGTNRILDFRSLLYRLSGGASKHHESGLNVHTDSLRKQRDRLRGL